jgi:hypothetical protein
VPGSPPAGAAQLRFAADAALAIARPALLKPGTLGGQSVVSRGARIVLGVAGALLVLAVGLGVATVTMGGNRFYVADGTAVVPTAVVRHVGTPALLCSGRGGPLETSAVYGAHLGRDLDQKPRVFCGAPHGSMSFEYRESVYSSNLPRRMHVYVWLERHAELGSLCAGQAEPVVEVEVHNLKGYASAGPPDRPCLRPDTRGGLGYTIVFDGSVPGDRETRQVELRVAGYP